MEVDDENTRKLRNEILNDIYRYYGLALIQQELFVIQPPAIAKKTAEKKMTCLKKLKSKKWWNPLMKFLRFTMLFLIVMGILFAGATVFVLLEDPVDKYSEEVKNTSDLLIHRTNLSKDDFSDGNVTLFRLYLQQRYKINIGVTDQEDFLLDVIYFRDAITRRIDKEKKKEQLKDRTNIFIKWFYFATIATTTIGYGDIAPTSEYGRLFYICFSVVGIPLMMILLASCGDIMTLVNKKMFGFFNKCLCKKKKLVSEELLSAISIFLLFAGYMCVGCVFTVSKEEWTLLDSIYFWIVTFTTVGFGDIHPSLETEIQYIVPLVVYRCFGLALLAGLVDSLVAWGKARKEALKEEALRLKRQPSLSLNKKFEMAKNLLTPKTRKTKHLTVPNVTYDSYNESSEL